MTRQWSSEDGAWGVAIHVGSGQPPVFQQIVDQIRFHIGAGHIPTSGKLPTIRDLADALGVNFNTVGRAYQELASQGLIIGRKGGGSSVSDKPAIPRQKKEQALTQLYRRFLTEAASYGVSAQEIKKFVQMEKTA